MICRARGEYSLINGPSPFCQPPQRREGFYKDYEVEVKEQDVDDAKSTFKSAKATAKGKNKYVGVLGVLIVGSFIIPMLQYFWCKFTPILNP